MNIAIVDDEQSEIDAISGIIKDYALQDKTEITIHPYHSGEEIIEDYRPYSYTAIFMDVYMEGMDGVSAAEKILSMDRSAVMIFLTSSDSHMPNAFSIHAYDYISKPATKERLFKVLNDVCLKSLEYNDETRFIFLHNGTEMSLSFSDIAVVRTERRNYLEIIDAFGTSYLTRMTFERAADTLAKDPRFLLTLRGVLVNMEHIRRIEGESCYLTNGEQLSLNVRKAKELTTIWQNYRLDAIRNERRNKIRRLGK